MVGISSKVEQLCVYLVHAASQLCYAGGKSHKVHPSFPGGSTNGVQQ